TTVASLSPETIAKQIREHPELTALDYLMIQRTVDAATIQVQDTPNSMIFTWPCSPIPRAGRRVSAGPVRVLIPERC
ncbi:MAG: hypothetical protein ABI876_08110, partial [Bacteroidota bacterium]